MHRSPESPLVARILLLPLVVAFLLSSLLASLMPLNTVSAQDSTPVATSGEEVIPDLAIAPPDATPELVQQLADKYAPIINIKVQPYDCDTVGESYLPVPVDAILGDPQVRLIQRVEENGKMVDKEVMTGPTAADLYGLDDTYYIDLPGDSRQPGCDYETWSRERAVEQGTQPAVYARVAMEEGVDGQIALQYWYYWVYNQFNNLHESDWEMIQLTFDADTVEEALAAEAPASVVFAQHAGGESANWDDDKITRDGNHIHTYSAAGSHATYYQPAIWIGWGANGSGFGCDTIDPDIETLSTPTNVLLLPSTTEGIAQTDDLAWLTFDGRWGQRQAWEFNGPYGLNTGTKWLTPISWTEDLRDYSLAIPHNETIGPGPSALFCSLSSLGGSAMALFPVYPQIVVGLSVVALVAIGWFVFWARHQIKAAFLQYFKHIRHYGMVSIWLLLVAIVTNQLTRVGRDVLQSLSSDNLRLTDTGGGGAFSLAPTFGIGSLQQFALALLVAPVIMVLTEQYARGEQHGHLLDVWRETLPKWWVLLRVNLLNAVILILLAITIVGIPIAIYKNVQWFWSSQSAILNDARVREARHQSRRLSKRHWWSTLRMAILVAVVSGIPGPIVGMIFFLTSIVSIETAGLISGLFYAICYPIAMIAATLYYLELREEKEEEGTLQVEPTKHYIWQRGAKSGPTTASSDTPGSTMPAD